jgi:Tol biopolymer transport system component
MVHFRMKLALSAGLFAALLPLGTATIATAGADPEVVTVTDVARYSTDADGKQAKDFSKNPVFSPDGAKIVFESQAANLVKGDTNLRWDIFVKTLASGAIVRVSTTSSGKQANDDNGQPVFSPDGKSVAFRSFASNLAGGFNSQWHIYVKNLNTGAVTRVSTTSGGAAANGFSYNPTFSPDGKFIAFESDATNLVSGDNGQYRDIFVKNLTTGAVIRVSQAGTKGGNGDSANPVFSPDSSKVAFDSFASNLVSKDSNGYKDVFVATLAGGAITRVSTDADGKQAKADSGNPAFSPDGSKVAFWSNWPQVKAGDSNVAADIFVKTLSSGAVIRLSNNDNDKVGNSVSFNPAFSPDGKSIAFISLSSNLVKGDRNNKEDIFVKSLSSSEIARVSITFKGKEANGRSWTEDTTGKSYAPAFSPNSARIVFPSDATNLVKGDTNGFGDVFVVTMTGN